jgi:hypothetical protein
METYTMDDHPTVLFASHTASQCGVYQFGLHVAEALKASQKYRFAYVECDGANDYSAALDSHKPVAVIVNYYPSTMPWLDRRILGQRSGPKIGVMHEVTQKNADAATDDLFDFHIAPDPTLLLRNPIVFKTGRLIPHYQNQHAVPAVPTIGSFGFATHGKGFERLVTEVQQAFSQAVIRLSIPFASFSDRDGKQARAAAERCRSLMVNPGVRLEVNHDFLGDEDLLNFLGQNSLNAFLYDYQNGRGLASAVDYALAVQRPIAVTRSSMFRHISSISPPVTVEDSPLSEILARGFAPLSRCRKEWTSENLVWDYERIVGAVLSAVDKSPQSKSVRDARRALQATARRILSSVHLVKTIVNRSASGEKVIKTLERQPALVKALSFLQAGLAGKSRVGFVRAQPDWVPDPAQSTASTPRPASIPGYDPAAVRVDGFNRILDQTASRSYQPTIHYLFQHMPGIMSRKIPEANVQQAFVLDTVVRLVSGKEQPAILSVGSYEDTASGCLLRSGYSVDEIDPLLNYDLATYMTKPTCRRASFDVVFATSVIEHVADDGQFLKDMEELLAPGGVCVLTCDFNDQYRPGDPIPHEDRRLYTRRDLLERLMPFASRSELVDPPQWDCPNPSFIYGGCRYTFASLVFRRVR